MAPICRSTKHASTKAASARSMRARIFRCRAARARLSRRLPAIKRTPTPHKFHASIEPPSDRSEGVPFWIPLLRLLVDPAPQQPHVADVGAEQHVERIACE